jgi:glycosyltransferase involved in cell wall biosynthesis
VRILVLSARHPFPATRGDERRVLHLVEGLSRRAEVTLACLQSGPELPFDGVRVRSVTQRLPSVLRENLRRRDPRLPLQVRLQLDSRMRRLVDGLVRDWRPDVVHASLARMAPYLPPAGTCHRHVDLVDALSVNMATRAGVAPRMLRPALALESRLLARAEACWGTVADSCSLVSDDDRRAVPGLEGAAVVGNGVDLAAIGFRDPAQRPPTLLFFGNLGYFHNVAPARYVAQEIVPRVRRSCPGAVLRIAGARPSRAVRELDALSGVSVVGPVADMAAELHRAAVAVVPMFSGSGMKNKVLEAFAAGTPVVTNALGIQGIAGARPGRHYLDGETTGELAAACATLLASPRARVAVAAPAFELVRDAFTWEAKVDQLLELYATPPSGPQAPAPPERAAPRRTVRGSARATARP